MYRIYKNILHSFQADFKILVYFDIFAFGYLEFCLSVSLYRWQVGCYMAASVCYQVC